MTIKEIITAKATSGRYFLTIITGIVFAYVAFKKIIGADVIATIITLVFSLYFSKDKSKEDQNNK